MRKSWGTVCAASAVAALVGWGTISGLAGARDAQAGMQHQQFGQQTWQQPGYGMQDYGVPGQAGFTGQQQFYGQYGTGQQHGWGTAHVQQPGQLGITQPQFQAHQPWQQQYGWGPQQQFQQPGQQFGFTQQHLQTQPWQQQYGWGPQQFQQPGQLGITHQQQYYGPGMGATGPGQQFGQLGMIGPQQQPTIQLELAIEQLQQSIRALAQQQPSFERDRAVDAAHRALREANQALIAIAPLAPPPPQAITQFTPGMPPQMQLGPLAGLYGGVQQQSGMQQFHQGQFAQPQMMGQQFQQQPQFHGQFGTGQQQFGQPGMGYQQFGQPGMGQQQFGQPDWTWQQGMTMQPGMTGQIGGQARDQARVDHERFDRQ